MPANTAKLSVLVLEDEPGLRHFLEQYLRRQGMEVEACGTVAKALEAASSKNFHLAVVDYGVTGLSWHSFYLKIRKCSPALPILCCSGLPVNPSGEHVSFLQKPFSSSQLMKAIAGLKRQ